MCGNTKQRIADVLRQMMNGKPFEKITVRNLMDATNMKRQSFYYHFKDTRDVLMWICRRDLIDPLRDSPLEFTDWFMAGITLLEADRSFCRKAIRVVYQEFVEEFDRQVMIPRVRAVMYPGTQVLDANRQFAVEFTARSFTNRMMVILYSGSAVDPAQLRERIDFLCREVLKS